MSVSLLLCSNLHYPQRPPPPPLLRGIQWGPKPLCASLPPAARLVRLAAAAPGDSGEMRLVEKRGVRVAAAASDSGGGGDCGGGSGTGITAAAAATVVLAVMNRVLYKLDRKSVV